MTRSSHPGEVLVELPADHDALVDVTFREHSVRVLVLVNDLVLTARPSRWT